VRYRGLVLAVLVACLAGLTPALASAANGATLTVPAQVQANTSAAAVVQPSFSYPEATPFCTVGVDFTWDGGSWISEFPTKNGALCVAGGVNAPVPAGKSTAGSHQVCASAGVQFKDCKALSVVIVAGTPVTPKPSGLTATPTAAANQAPTPLPAQVVPTATPAIPGVAGAVERLSPEQRLLGLALFAVGVLGLLTILARRFLLGRRRKPAGALPSPGGPVQRR
jgi:hypothetical protein